MKTKIFLFVTFIILFSCNNDDSNSSELTLEELRDETTIILTSSGDSKTWRISQAKLINGNSQIDISQNFNVVDDEFIFGGTTDNGTLEWRKGYEIQTNASNSQETLLDKYVSSITTNFSYQSGSSTVVEADFGSCVFQINDDDSIRATITNDNNTVFDFILIEKTQADYATASQTGLNFSLAFTFESNDVNGSANVGMIGSNADNSLFIAVRENDLNNGSANPERIIKFDITTGASQERLFFQNQFVTKRLHIVGEQLIVIGGQYVNTYDLNLSGDPLSVSHGRTLSRFGISTLNDNVFLIGGNIEEPSSGIINGNTVFRWNLNTQSLTEFTTLYEPRFRADGTIINDNLYIFGGNELLSNNTTIASNIIHKINLNNPSNIEIFESNQPIDITYVQRFQNLIYVAGQIIVSDANGNTIARESTIGVFNTLDNTYQELNTNLTNPSGYHTIHQMCVFNNKMYIIYGNEGIDNGGQFNEWKVLVSDLN